MKADSTHMAPVTYIYEELKALGCHKFIMKHSCDGISTKLRNLGPFKLSCIISFLL